MSETIIAAIIVALATVAAPVLVHVLQKRRERERSPSTDWLAEMQCD
jgi:hypothetical protein